MEKRSKELPKVLHKNAKKILFPKDEVNKDVFGPLTQDLKQDNINVTYNMRPNQPDLKADIVVTLEFYKLNDFEIKFDQKLSGFDKRVCMAADALYDEGCPYITATQIYYAMGGTGRPAPKQLQRISDAASKMIAIKMDITNKPGHHDCTEFKYEGPVFPAEKVSALVHGQEVAGVIHLFRRPALLDFAREHGQCTTASVELLQSPLTRTELNIALEDYLLDQISWKKKKNVEYFTLLFGTLFEKIRAKDYEAKRVKVRAEKYLNHCLKCDYIGGYEVMEDRLIIRL